MCARAHVWACPFCFYHIRPSAVFSWQAFSLFDYGTVKPGATMATTGCVALIAVKRGRGPGACLAVCLGCRGNGPTVGLKVTTGLKASAALIKISAPNRHKDSSVQGPTFDRFF